MEFNEYYYTRALGGDEVGAIILQEMVLEAGYAIETTIYPDNSVEGCLLYDSERGSGNRAYWESNCYVDGESVANVIAQMYKYVCFEGPYEYVRDE